jgi:precorrin-2/cobalt-factor-2 C20-methyltransferase
MARALDEIGRRLEAGKSVAFITEGDPSLYSTFVYVAREAIHRYPSIHLSIVPGVSSVTAVAGVTGVPLADGQERIAIIPATYGVDDLDQILRAFDTVVLMKLGPEMPKIVAALERNRLLDRAVYVSRATMKEQRILFGRELERVEAERGDCFAMVVVAKKERAGALVGAVPFSTVSA